MAKTDADQDEPAGTERGFRRLRSTLRLLYHGHSATAQRFQFAVLLVDLAIIAFFLIAPVWKERPSFLWLDFAVAAILTADIVARGLATTDIPRWLKQPTTIVDVVILATLLFPASLANLGFLRILRLWTLSRSGALWRPLRKRKGFQQWEETAGAALNLFTFIFVMTGFVYTFFALATDKITGYIDALYFTVTAMTTTGFGDIVLPGTFGKITSIAIMVMGITLLVRLAQAIVRPHKVHFPCPQCGLSRHDTDAVHCKACGHVLNIPDEGHW